MFATSERADIYMAGFVHWWHVENHRIIVDFVVCANIYVFMLLNFTTERSDLKLRSLAQLRYINNWVMHYVDSLMHMSYFALKYHFCPKLQLTIMFPIRPCSTSSAASFSP